MKLYTEEQVRQIYNIAYETGDSQFGADFDFDIKELSISPIELPSDEEINKVSLKGLTLATHISGFQMGAKWVIEKIKQQDK